MIVQMKTADRQRRAAIVLGLVLAWCPCVLALDPALDVSQYAHASWKIREGFSEGIIRSIAQTADGYLWLGTEFGLRRFDGVRAVPWEPPLGQHLPSSDIRSLQGARDGRLWIGTFSGLASWKDRELTHYPELDGQTIEALLEDREGTIWVAGWALSTGRLCSIQNGNIQCYGEDGRFGSGVTPLYEDSGGNLWAGGMTGVWRWKPGPPKLYPMPNRAQRIHALLESDDGALLIAQHTGITKLRNEKFEAYPLPAGFQPHRLLRDHDGGLWIGALVQRGLLHIHKGRTDRFTQAEGLSGRSVTSFFEDREGSIWVATGEGLDLFRDFAIPTFSDQQGFSSRGMFSILAARDGSLWLGTSDGLNRWSKGQITVYRYRGLAAVRDGPPISGLAAGTADSRGTIREITDSGLPDKAHSLFQDARGQLWVGTPSGVAFFKSDRFVPVAAVPYGIVFSFADDSAGNVWVSHQEGLLRLFGARVVERIPWARLGRREPASALLHDAVRGGLWLGFRDGGFAYFRDGQFRASYAGAEGLGEGEVRGFYVDRNGTLWAPTVGGLSRIKDGHILTLTNQNGLPCNTVHWMMEDDARSVWLYLACGLVRIGRSELDAWASHPKQTIHATVFDGSDGVTSHRLSAGYNSVVAKSSDGKMWFVRNVGVSVIDPHHLALNKLPPPVHIEQIAADGKTYAATNGLRLPPRIRDLEIDYTALSLVAPEKVRFRIKLEGQDQDWRELINVRHVRYTNLAPGHYRFRVLACNNTGVWNEEGASLDFAIAPAWFQTTWFRALCVLAMAALLWGLYRLRIRQLKAREERFREAVESMPALAFVAHADGSRVFVNRSWAEYTGLTVEQAMGFGWQAAVHPDDLERVLDNWRTGIAKGEPLEYDLRFRRADGDYRWFHVRAVSLRDTRGNVTKWYGVATDIEDRKRAEEERERLRQVEADLAHINRVSMMGELTTSIAHEVNQPLSGVVSNASASLRWLAREVPNVEEVREGLHRIVRDGKRAGEVIARIRALTRRAQMPREKLDLNETIREVLALVGDEAKRRSVIIRTRFAEDLSPVSGDRVQLQQVVLNLVMNGIEAMSSVEDRSRELIITTRNVDADRVQASVEDSGIGIDPQKLDKIFDSFYTTKPGGMGMGLSISRSILQAHGGRLWAAANDGPGTAFHFAIPSYHEEESNAAV